MSEQRLNGSIALHKLESEIITIKSKSTGQPIDVICIPIASNKLVKSKDGKGAYLNIQVVIKDTEDQYGNCAMVTKRVDMGKKWAELTDEEKKEKSALEPILGNLKDFGQRQPASHPAIVQQSSVSDSDLPF